MNPATTSVRRQLAPAASARLAVSLPSRLAAFGAGPERGGREPHSGPRHGTGKRRPAGSGTASLPSAASRCCSTSRRRARAPASSWPPRRLGADTTLVSSLSSSIEKGESLKDTGLTLRALGAEAIILRHNSSGAAWLLEADDAAAGAERRRRHARASDAGAARSAHDPGASAAGHRRR